MVTQFEICVIFGVFNFFVRRTQANFKEPVVSDDDDGLPHLSPATIARNVVGVEGCEAGHSVLKTSR